MAPLTRSKRKISQDCENLGRAKRGQGERAGDKNMKENRKEKPKAIQKVQIMPFNNKEHQASLGWESRRSWLNQWIEDFKQKELAGVVWNDSATPWKDALGEDQEIAAQLCDFETPSETAGLVLDCPVGEYPKVEEVPSPEVVELYVGPEKKLVRTNKEMLCKKIPYFSKMFQGSFQEAMSNSALFPEDQVGAFEDLIYWVTNGHLPPWIIHHQTEGFDPKEEIQAIAPVRVAFGFDFIALYALVDKLCAVDVMSLITDHVIGCMTLDASAFPIQNISKIYDSAPENSGLRRLACYIFSYYMASLEKSYPAEDLATLLQTVDDLAFDTINLQRLHPGPFIILPENLPACKFHDHHDGEACNQQKFRERCPGLRRPEKRHPERYGFEYLSY